MTEKRDLKRRVRERQATTGESYTEALHQVRARRPVSFPVVDMVDATEAGEALRLRCRVSIHPTLARRIEPARLLTRLRDLLLTTAEDPAMAVPRAVLLRGEQPAGGILERIEEGRRFVERARAGLGGVSPGGRMLALAVDSAMVLFLLWYAPVTFVHRPATLIITMIDDTTADPLALWRDVVP